MEEDCRQVLPRRIEMTTRKFNYLRDKRRNGKPDSSDQLQTPAYALEPLLPYLKPEWLIWEPACGEGLLVGALRDHGFAVAGSDILYGHDFLTMEPEKCDAVVTNPPYSKAAEFLERCYALGRPFALLVKVESIGTKGFQELYQQYGFEWIFVRPRINYKTPIRGWAGKSPFPTFWTTYGLNIGKTESFVEIAK
jgi:hypothetical protein